MDSDAPRQMPLPVIQFLNKAGLPEFCVQKVFLPDDVDNPLREYCEKLGVRRIPHVVITGEYSPSLGLYDTVHNVLQLKALLFREALLDDEVDIEPLRQYVVAHEMGHIRERRRDALGHIANLGYSFWAGRIGWGLTKDALDAQSVTSPQKTEFLDVIPILAGMFCAARVMTECKSRSREHAELSADRHAVTFIGVEAVMKGVHSLWMVEEDPDKRKPIIAGILRECERDPKWDQLSPFEQLCRFSQVFAKTQKMSQSDRKLRGVRDGFPDPATRLHELLKGLGDGGSGRSR